MTYKYVGPGSLPNSNKYEFTLTVFRDANGGGADFDFLAQIAIYEQVGSQYLLIYQGGEPIASQSTVPLVSLPCMDPPNVKVEQAHYIFTRDLEITGNSFHVSYQRCCRNETITNINNPGDMGATYTIEVTNEAMLAKSSSPTFKEIPPTVICNDFPLNYDHSAIDIDGDQLIYSFCSPLEGGGTILNPPGSNSCDGVTPTPACAPPYNLASFLQPTYSPAKPMAGNPVITINSSTGLITGIPHQIGQYVVAVCVKEFRAGKLLSTIRREFQFNVADCQPDVIANINKDSIIGFKEYSLLSCGLSDVSFINASEGNISDYYWEFTSSTGAVLSSNLKDPIFTFPDTGSYVGKMIVNKNSPCKDSVKIHLSVYGEVVANFSYEYDTCIAGPVQYTDASIASSNIINWTWDFGNGDGEKSSSPQYLYKDPGIYPVSLRVEDKYNCIGDTTVMITWQPAPSDIIIAPSTFNGCIPADIFFDNLSSPIDSTYTLEWDFGDGTSDSVVSPTHSFMEVGIYSIGVKIISPIGCKKETTFPNWIQVLPSPKAAFSYSPEVITSFNPIIDFTDHSEDAVRWFWDFDSLATTQEVNPTYAFQDTGKHLVSLRVVHESGCIDEITKVIDLVPEITFFMPNAFTPNEDNKNDIFKGTGHTYGIQNFEMIIWNRWGERIYKTDNIDEGWNGRKNNSGQAAPPGVYVYEVKYTNPRGKDFHFKGFATLIR